MIKEIDLLDKNLDSVHLKNNSTRIILIYHLGKVGSFTVHNTLVENDTSSDIFHITHLTNRMLIDVLPTLDEIYHHEINKGKFFRQHINIYPQKRIKVITLTRDPIARDISSAFEVWDDPFKNREPDEVSYSEVINFIKKMKHPYTLNWFKDEFESYLNYDIYSKPFNKDVGYSIYNLEKFDLLVIKSEYLNDVYKDAFKKFLNIDVEYLINSNQTKDKKFNKIYSQTKKGFKYPIDKLKKIYSTKYVQHFYRKDEIEGFINKWRM